jgi:transcriptional regulator with XRE-family HTH domain
MSEKERIEQIILEEGISSGQFAAEIGIQSSTLSHLLNDRNKPSLDVMKKILNRYPEISSDWLIMGVGSMFRDTMKPQTHTLFDNLSANTSLSEDNNAKTPKETIVISTPKENEMLNSHHNPPIIQNDNPVISSNSIQPPIEHIIKKNNRNVVKIILYFDDNTFQEFDSK